MCIYHVREIILKELTMSKWTQEFNETVFQEPKNFFTRNTESRYGISLTIIGEGCSTSVCTMNGIPKDMVLIVTREKSKQKYAKQLSKTYKGFKYKKASKYLKTKKQKEFIKKLKGYNEVCYFVSRLKPFRPHADSFMYKVLQRFKYFTEGEPFISKNFPETEFTKLAMKVIHEEFELFEGEIRKTNIIVKKKLKKSFIKFLKTITSAKITEEFQLDIHSEQFCQIGEEIICIDPIWFEFDY